MTREFLINSLFVDMLSDEDSTNAHDRDPLVDTLQEVYGMTRPEAIENAEFLQRSSEPI